MGGVIATQRDLDQPPDGPARCGRPGLCSADRSRTRESIDEFVCAAGPVAGRGLWHPFGALFPADFREGGRSRNSAASVDSVTTSRVCPECQQQFFRTVAVWAGGWGCGCLVSVAMESLRLVTAVRSSRSGQRLRRGWSDAVAAAGRRSADTPSAASDVPGRLRLFGFLPQLPSGKLSELARFLPRTMTWRGLRPQPKAATLATASAIGVVSH